MSAVHFPCGCWYKEMNQFGFPDWFRCLNHVIRPKNKPDASPKEEVMECYTEIKADGSVILMRHIVENETCTKCGLILRGPTEKVKTLTLAEKLRDGCVWTFNRDDKNGSIPDWDFLEKIATEHFKENQ